MTRRLLYTGVVCLGAFTAQAHAGFIWFTLNGSVPGMQATVAEQILCITPGNCNAGNPNRTLDYQYFVFNTGNFVMDGFSVGVGGRAVAIAGGENFSDTAGGADGPFPAATGGGVTNAIAFLGQPAVNPVGVTSQPPGQGITAFSTLNGTDDISTPGGGGWGFEEFDNFSAGQNPVSKAYQVRWYTALQGGAGRATLYNNGCNGNIPVANGAGVGLNNTSGVLNTALNCNGNIFFAAFRVDLFSPNSPVAGTGAPDPFGSGWDLSFDDDVSGIDTSFDDTSLPPDTTICDPSVTTCGTLSEGFDSSNTIAPEPGAFFLVSGGLLALGLAGRRRRRN